MTCRDRNQAVKSHDCRESIVHSEMEFGGLAHLVTSGYVKNVQRCKSKLDEIIAAVSSNQSHHDDPTRIFTLILL